MRSSFARDVRDAHNAVIPVSENYPLVFATSGAGGSGSSFVLGPGYQVIESGQVPQALPGQTQPHDVSPPPASNPQAAAAPPSLSSAGPQSVIMAPSPSPLAESSSSQQAGSSIGSASVPSAVPSGPTSVQSSAATFATSSSSPPNSVPPTSSAGVALSAVPTSTFFPSSTFGTASSASNITPAVAFSSSTSPHGASFWTAIALVSIAGVATIITLFMWWLRVRARTHRRPWESRWPWGRAESYRFPEDAISSSGTSASWWQPHGGDRDRDVGEPRHSMSTSSDLPSTRGTSSSTASSAELHLPPLTALSPFAHGPYPTVRPLPLELRRSDTSVPGLMQDVGALHVANLVAGDILTSGDESSRPPTALDDVVGTPREDRAVFKPRYLSLNGSGGLGVPWITTPPASEPPKPQPPEWSGPPVSVGTGASAPVPLPPDHNQSRWKERLERSSASHDPPTGTIEAWRDSLRSNIVNALGVFTSATPAPAPATTHPSITAYDWQQHPAVGRAPSTTSTSSKPWTLEETRDGAGIVHIRGVPDPTSIDSSASRKGNDGGGGAMPRASLIPPRLPHLPPMPLVPRTSGLRTASTKRQYGSRSRRRRPCSAVVRRASSSASSAATSVGSDMSRAEGSSAVVARWARLSEKEEAARRALRQRRIKSGRSGGGVRMQRTRSRGSGSRELEPIEGGGGQ